jgi:hypothetical protein
MATQATGTDFTSNLGRVYAVYTGGFIGFVLLLAILEQVGVPNYIIGYLFVAFTIGIYALIGIMSRTMQVSEYYVAGRKVPAFYNGMATGADWMSAASFIGMAGTLYALGYDGLAYILGWTGGYVLVATLIAPYLRKFGCYTVPDSWPSGTAATSPASPGSWCCWLARSPMWWRRSSVPVSSGLGSSGWTTRLRCMSGSSASWSARCSAACGR